MFFCVNNLYMATIATLGYTNANYLSLRTGVVMTETESMQWIRYLLDKVINYGFAYNNIPHLTRIETKMIKINGLTDEEVINLLKLYKNTMGGDSDW